MRLSKKLPLKDSMLLSSRLARNKSPTSSITAKDLSLLSISATKCAPSLGLNCHNWWMEFLMTRNRVVATKNKNRLPKMVTYQLSLKPRMLRMTCRTCCAPSGPKLLERCSSNPLPISFGVKKKPNRRASKNTMGGSAKVVKKAVAPASTKGSLRRNNWKDGTTLPKKLVIKDRKLVVCFSISIKISINAKVLNHREQREHRANRVFVVFSL